MITPMKLQAIRTLLGLSREEAALAMGGLPQNELRVLERTNTFFVLSGHDSMLSGMLERIEKEIEAALAPNAPPDFLITYTKDVDFTQFARDLQSWMLFSSVHRMFTARVWSEWRREGHAPVVIGLRVPDYLEFLGNRPDTQGELQSWAKGYSQNYRLVQKMPTAVEGKAQHFLEKRSKFQRGRHEDE